MSWSASDPTVAESARELGVWPLDESNARLLDAVHPRTWKDPTPSADTEYDLLVIGAGAGGLVSSKQSGRRGARSCMISEHLAGGDCLNVGCVPSKALLHCARVAREARDAFAEGFLVGPGGTPAPAIAVDFGAVMARMRKLRADIAPADSHDGTAAAGADVYQGRGRFTGPNEVEVNGQRLRFKKAVIATGGRATVPTTPGLAEAPYVTNATLFNLTALPPRMVIVGAGVVAMEMAQAFASFGAAVTVLVRSKIMSRDEPAAADAVRKALEKDGVTFLFSAELQQVTTLRQPSAEAGATSLPLLGLTVGDSGNGGGPPTDLECEALLVATGRSPNVEGMGLEEAGIEFDPIEGIRINDLGATTNASVYAVGDCVAGVPRFTHMSGEMAKLVVQNALFDDTWSVASLVVPRCCYTDPEVASVGLTKADAAKRGMAVDTYSNALEHNDRIILESQTQCGGFVDIHCKQGTDTIVGATVVAPGAGNIINEVTLAMQAGVGLGALARVIHPYPTVGEGVMQAALGFIRKHWAKK